MKEPAKRDEQAVTIARSLPAMAVAGLGVAVAVETIGFAAGMILLALLLAVRHLIFR